MDVTSPMMGTVLSLPVDVGQPVTAGTTLIVLESMKMEHPVTAPADGTIATIAVTVGSVVAKGDLLASLSPGDVDAATETSTDTVTGTPRPGGGPGAPCPVGGRSTAGSGGTPT
jgi:acetyl-CoA/propionyl-CoA carboxylase, biotin carboxylase, biotin carboxyl carrier protein